MDYIQKQTATDYIKECLCTEGFEKTGIAPAKILKNSSYLKEWLSDGRHGEMHWMENYLDKRLDVTKLYPEAQSVVSVGLNYYSPNTQSDDLQRGKISRYAWGKDYHRIIKKKLKRVLANIHKRYPEIEGRLFVDTAPIQDKLWAIEAGLGWQGKNTNILTRDYGSWLFLGEIILNTALVYDEPMGDYCGKCTACIDACPTQALTPYKLDARRCIAYLTIEMWDTPLPAALAPKIGTWIFGCDICQDVCPWNRFQKTTRVDDFKPMEKKPNHLLQDLLAMDEADFNKTFKKTPVARAKYTNFMRNVKNADVNNQKEEKKGNEIIR